MGGNAFLRFSSSVAAGALILPQVARAQECVKTYEGCGSCDNPNLRYLTVVSSENLTTIQYTNCGSEPFSNAVTLENINNDITTLRAGDNLTDCTGNDDVSVVSFPCVIDNAQFFVDFDGQQTSLPRLEKIRFANLRTVGELYVRTISSFFGFLVLICFILQQYRSLTNHSQQHNNHSYQTTTNNNNRFKGCPL